MGLDAKVAGVVLIVLGVLGIAVRDLLWNPEQFDDPAEQTGLFNVGNVMFGLVIIIGGLALLLWG